MADNLTARFKEELSKKGIVATDSQIESVLSNYRATSQMPTSIGGNLYNNISHSLLKSPTLPIMRIILP